MTLPRRVLPSTFLITRRCAERKLLLRPDDELNGAFLYCVLAAAERFDVEVHGLVALSNHVHWCVTTKKANLPRFLHLVHMNMARLVNTHRRRRDAVWSSVEKTSVVPLPDANSVLEKLVYVAVNPVAAGLVPTPDAWPGLRTLPADVGETLVADRPGFYFRSAADAAAELGSDGVGEAQARRRRHVRGTPVQPPRVELTLTRPPQFADMTDAEFRALFSARVDEAVAAHQAARRAARRAFAGAATILAQDPESIPGGPSVPEYKLSPTVATRDPALRRALLAQNRAFRLAYRTARLAFRAGDRNVRFPEHTYGPCVFYGARCFGSPPEHAGAGSRLRPAA